MSPITPPSGRYEKVDSERLDAPDYDQLAREVVRLMPRLRGPLPPGTSDACCGPGDAAPGATEVPCAPDCGHPHPHPPLPHDLRDATRGAPIALATLAQEGGSATPGRLCALSGLSKGRISNIVRSLEEKGYVTKSPSPSDARSVVVELTAKGRAFTDAHEHALCAHAAALLRQLGPRDAQDAVRILRHLSEIMGCCPDPKEDAAS